MDIEISQKDLYQSLQCISNIVSDRQSIPILANVLVETTAQDRLIFSATDLKISVEYDANARVVKPGSITIPAKRLAQIVKELPDGLVRIKTDMQNHIEIMAGKSYFKIMGLPKEEFPPITFFSAKSIVLQQKQLKDLLKKTIIAVSADATRHILNGIYVKGQGQQLIFVATDGRRLSYAEVTLEKSLEQSFSFILPGKMAQELLKILQDHDSVTMAVGDKDVIFKWDHVRYMCQLIDGKYPNYEQVLPKEFPASISIDRQELYSALRRSSILIDQKLNRVKMEFKSNSVDISTQTPDLGESKEELDVKYGGDPVSIGFSPHYIMDALKVMDDEVVSLGVTPGAKSGVLHGKDNFVYVIMPMRLV